MELESASSAEEIPVQQNTFSNNQRQRWEIKRRPDGFYTIKNMYSGLYAGVQDKSSINGASIVQYADYDDYIEDKSKWSFGISTAGNYILSPTSSHTEGRVLAVPSSTSGAGANLIQYSYIDNTDYTDEWDIFFTVGANLGSVSSWYSNMFAAGVWMEMPKIYVEDMTDGDFIDFNGSVSHAISQWNDALGMSIEEPFESDGTQKFNEVTANIKIYGLTLDQYNQEFKTEYGEWENSNSGSAITYYYENQYYYLTYNGNSIEVQIIYEAVIFVLYDSNRTTVNHEKDTLMHELGHALGYHGHNTNRLSVMYPSCQAISLLQYQDIYHLNQIYDSVRLDIGS